MKKYKATKNEIKQFLHSYYKRTGEIPKYTLRTVDLGISPTVVRTVFGTWNAALEYSNLRPRIKGRITTSCNNCFTPINIPLSVFNSFKHNFCSRSCAATFNNKFRTHTEQTKLKISKSLKSIKGPPRPPKTYNRKCENCHTHFQTPNKKKKFCSRKCRSTVASERTSEWLRNNRDHIRGPHKQSYMEKSFEDWLKQQGIKRGLSGYLTEVYFYNPTTRKNGWADFVFPRAKVIVELDGTHHQKRKELDKIRDNFLHSRGWDVIRITHKEYQKRTQVTKIKNILKKSDIV